MHILVTNDDGVFAPGLLALVEAVRPFGKVSIVAPDKNWSVCGHVKTMDRSLRVKEVTLSDGTPALCSDGSPSDCIALAVMGLLDDPVDMVVSGINPYPNLGHDITYSGTVTNAMEAAIWGVRGIAVSLDGFAGIPPGKPDELDYSPVITVTRKIITMILHHEFSTDIILNVNVPCLPERDIKGYMVTRLGKRIYRDILIKREDPRGKPYYWIGGEPPSGVAEPGTDIGALAAGYVSITPLSLDLTSYSMVDTIKNWNLPQPG